MSTKLSHSLSAELINPAITDSNAGLFLRDFNGRSYGRIVRKIDHSGKEIEQIHTAPLKFEINKSIDLYELIKPNADEIKTHRELMAVVGFRYWYFKIGDHFVRFLAEVPWGTTNGVSPRNAKNWDTPYEKTLSRFGFSFDQSEKEPPNAPYCRVLQAPVESSIVFPVGNSGILFTIMFDKDVRDGVLVPQAYRLDASEGVTGDIVPLGFDLFWMTKQWLADKENKLKRKPFNPQLSLF